MATQTPNFSFELPEDGADNDLWGTYLNQNWSSLDDLLVTIQTTIQASIAELEAKALIPVGGLYLSTDDTDPATTLGYGTWEVHAAGRALIGVGNNGESDWAIDQERGSEAHQLTENELPAHSHTMSATAVTVDAHNETFWFETRSLGNGQDFVLASSNVSQSRLTNFNNNLNEGSTDKPRNRLTWNINHTHGATFPQKDTNSKGGGAAHNNVQPSIAVYVWKRAA